MPTENILTRVLVVDDEQIIADSLALILRGQGLDARAAYSGEDAAALALAWKPDVVISDVIMGKMDGVSLALYLAQALPACKVLLMTAQIATEPLLAESKKLGHDFQILTKPFTPDSIFSFLGAASPLHSDPAQQA